MPTPPPNPGFLPLLLGVLSPTNEPVFPSTALTKDSVSRLPMTSRNSVLVNGCKTESRLQSMQYASYKAFTVGATLLNLDGVAIILDAATRFRFSSATRAHKAAFC